MFARIDGDWTPYDEDWELMVVFTDTHDPGIPFPARSNTTLP